MMACHNRLQIGQRRGALVLIARDASGTDRHPKYRVRCDCGKEYVMAGTTFAVAKACKKCRPGGAKRKYGDRVISNQELYRIWAGMRHRCNPNATARKNARWGARGIRVCEEWNDYVAFEAWALANGYETGLSLDRVNNDGNYEPSNCEWVTRSINSKRARALYHFVPKKPGMFFDYLPIEALYGNPT